MAEDDLSLMKMVKMALEQLANTCPVETMMNMGRRESREQEGRRSSTPTSDWRLKDRFGVCLALQVLYTLLSGICTCGIISLQCARSA